MVKALRISPTEVKKYKNYISLMKKRNWNKSCDNFTQRKIKTLELFRFKCFLYMKKFKVLKIDRF